MIRWSIKAFCHKKKTITMLNCLETLSWDILKALLFSCSIYMLVITKGGTSATGHVLSEFLVNYKLVNFNSNALMIFRNDCSINCLMRILFERVTNKILLFIYKLPRRHRTKLEFWISNFNLRHFILKCCLFDL